MPATIGIVMSASTRYASILVYGKWLFYFRLDEAEQNENVTVSLSPTVRFWQETYQYSKKKKISGTSTCTVDTTKKNVL